MQSDADRRERAEAAHRQQAELAEDLKRYQLAKQHFAALARRARRFAPLTGPKQRWRGLRDD